MLLPLVICPGTVYSPLAHTPNKPNYGFRLNWARFSLFWVSVGGCCAHGRIKERWDDAAGFRKNGLISSNCFKKTSIQLKTKNLIKRIKTKIIFDSKIFINKQILKIVLTIVNNTLFNVISPGYQRKSWN